MAWCTLVNRSGNFPTKVRESRNLAWRRDLQILRAAAVIGVILNHIGDWLPGGYLGVDVFFVISGFIVASSLFREISISGQVSWRDFFLRRFWRLFPALSLVLIVTLIFSLLLLPPIGPMQDVSKTALAGLFGLANVALSQSERDYFAASAESNPLLHTWSLSVEEQFYILLAVLLLVTTRIFGSHRRKFLIILLALTFLSIFAAFFGRYFQFPPFFADHALGFYSPVVRIWEFGFGVISALLRPSLGSRVRNRFGPFFLVAGFSVVGISLIFLSKDFGIPGPIQLVPVAGAALVTLGNPPRKIPLLVKKPAQIAELIGDWSYSLYLWHWPGIVLFSFALPELPYAKLLGAAVSVVPAIFFFYLVEQKFRQGRSKQPKWLTGVGLFIAPLVIAGVALVSSEQDARAEFSALRPPLIYELGCHGPQLRNGQVPVCEWRPANPSVNVYLVGDSHAAMYSEGLLAATNDLGLGLQTLTASACPLLDGATPEHSDWRHTSDCSVWQEQTQKKLSELDPGIVVMAFTANYVLGDGGMWSSDMARLVSSQSGKVALFEKSLEKTVLSILESGHRVLVVRPIPIWIGEYFWDPQLMTRQELTEGEPQEMPLTWFSDLAEPLSDGLRRITSDTGASEVEFSNVLCEDGLCRNHDGQGWLYRDYSHISNDQSIALAPQWVEILNEEKLHLLENSKRRQLSFW